jgi:HSP20 family protein
MATTMLEKKTETRPYPWKPLTFFEGMEREFENLWDRMLPTMPRAFTRPFLHREEGAIEWYPRLDAFEKDGKLFVKVDLPGLKKEDVHVTLDNGSLVIEGARDEEKEVKKDNYYRCERAYGKFYRRLPLGFEIEPKMINAKFHDGILEVSVPLPEEATKKVENVKIT